MALAGHSGSHKAQSIHSSGLMTKKIRTFIKAINRTNFNTVGIFTADTVISYNKSHVLTLAIGWGGKLLPVGIKKLKNDKKSTKWTAVQIKTILACL